jgi:hypothetical protein
MAGLDIQHAYDDPLVSPRLSDLRLGARRLADAFFADSTAW